MVYSGKQYVDSLVDATISNTFTQEMELLRSECVNNRDFITNQINSFNNVEYTILNDIVGKCSIIKKYINCVDPFLKKWENKLLDYQRLEEEETNKVGTVERKIKDDFKTLDEMLKSEIPKLLLLLDLLWMDLLTQLCETQLMFYSNVNSKLKISKEPKLKSLNSLVHSKKSLEKNTCSKEEFCNSVRAIYDFEGEKEEDLRMKEGDLLVVLETNGEWYYGYKQNNQSVKGWYPSTYTETC